MVRKGRRFESVRRFCKGAARQHYLVQVDMLRVERAVGMEPLQFGPFAQLTTDRWVRDGSVWIEGKGGGHVVPGLLPDKAPDQLHAYYTCSIGWQPAVAGHSRFELVRKPCSSG